MSASSTAFSPIVVSVKSPAMYSTFPGNWSLRACRGPALRASAMMLFGGVVVRRYLDMARPRPVSLSVCSSTWARGGGVPREAPVTMIVLGAILSIFCFEKGLS